MFTVDACLANDHDYRLVGLAAVVCLFTSLTAINALRWLANTRGRQRLAWLTAAAVVTGFGVWSTHFIANHQGSTDGRRGWSVARRASGVSRRTAGNGYNGIGRATSEGFTTAARRRADVRAGPPLRWSARSRRCALSG